MTVYKTAWGKPNLKAEPYLLVHTSKIKNGLLLDSGLG